MNRKRLRYQFISVLVLAVLAGLVSYPRLISFFPPLEGYFNKFEINLGLDLQGGIRLEYAADTSQVEKEKEGEALQAAQDVIERRVNAFGVGEPLVQIARSGEEQRVLVELPGVENIEEAKNRIKDTPILEFREEGGEDSEGRKLIEDLNSQAKQRAQEVLERALQGEDFSQLAQEFSQDPASKEEGGDLGFVSKGTFVPEFDEIIFERDLENGQVYPELIKSDFGWHIVNKIEEKEENGEELVRARHILFRELSLEDFPELYFENTGLTGKNLEDAQVVFASQGVSEPQISIRFDEEGTEIFAEITKRNINKPLAIFLDGELISAPTVQTEITNGEAVITGSFTVEEAREQVRRLNEGALPVPLKLVSQESIEASLGNESLRQSLVAGLYGIIAVIIFMIVYYRFFGVLASMSLMIYSAIMVSIFKLSGSFTPFPITLTLSGIAGFILSLGMAVDANILIFERIKEELIRGRSIKRSIEEGFKRAWPSIRDGNLSTIITCMILIWIGTSFVKGFALILVIGVLVSMFTAIVLTKIIIRFFVKEWINEKRWLLMPISKYKKE